jgi:hypothetical protein
MDNERDRRSWPDEDRPAEPTTPEPDWTAPAEPAADAGSDEPWTNPEQPEPMVSEPSGTDPGGTDPAGRDEVDSDAAAPAEIESWPSQEPSPATAHDTRTWPTEPPPAGSAPSDAWSTEPPAAGSAPADAWPTAAPERTDATMPSDDAWGEPEAAETSAEAPGAPDAADVAAVAAVGGLGEPVGEGVGSPSPDRAPEEVEAYPATGASPPAEVAPAAAAAVTPAHSVPDAERTTGESTQCPRCGTENRPGLSFCRNCGQRLVAAGAASTVERPGVPEGTMACPRCGTHNRAGVAFCQNCGANLRGTAEGYVPPAAAVDEGEAVAAPQARGAVLGPVVLLIGLAGLITGYLLPFLYGDDSLFARAWGTDGYGIAFWNGYPEVGASLADQAYFGLTGPIPLLGLLLLALAVAGFVRAAPGMLQSLGLGIALLWSVGLIVLFLIVEVAGNWDGDMVGLLRVLTPAGIIFFLSSLIVMIGTLTRFSRG